MSAPKMVPERDAILRERKAFADGADFQEAKHRASAMCRHCFSSEIARYEADGRFPLPQVERPRVLVDEDGYSWRWRDGHGLEIKAREGSWSLACELHHILRDHADCRRIIAALLASPTELVDDSGDTA